MSRILDLIQEWNNFIKYNGNNGTMNGDIPWSTDVPQFSSPKRYNSLSFDGVDDYVEIQIKLQ